MLCQKCMSVSDGVPVIVSVVNERVNYADELKGERKGSPRYGFFLPVATPDTRRTLPVRRWSPSCGAHEEGLCSYLRRSAVTTTSGIKNVARSNLSLWEIIRCSGLTVAAASTNQEAAGTNQTSFGWPRPAVSRTRRISPLARRRWLAYESDESGAARGLCATVPECRGGRWQVSSGGGTRPLWAKNGQELFYLAIAGADPTLMNVRVARGATQKFPAERKA
jgi:hypothetical protein